MEQVSVISINHYLVLAVILFFIGAGGVLVRRCVLTMLMSVELMLNAVNLTILAFARYNLLVQGHVMVFFVITVAAAEAAVGLAIILMVFRHRRSVNADEITLLKH